MMEHKKTNKYVHRVSADLRNVLESSQKLREAWKNITPLARNEWICWIESAKKVKTMKHRIERMRDELLSGKRRPCCWPGCTHR